METTIRKLSLAFLNSLVGHPLLYAVKSPDTELYDFGFGKLVETENRRGKRKTVGTQSLHVLCRFKVIWKTGKKRLDIYHEDTPSEKFYSEVKQLIGLNVKRIALSDKNDLWIDFDDCWIVFATFENGEESWRFFVWDRAVPHLVASNLWLDFIN